MLVYWLQDIPFDALSGRFVVWVLQSTLPHGHSSTEASLKSVSHFFKLMANTTKMVRRRFPCLLCSAVSCRAHCASLAQILETKPSFVPPPFQKLVARVGTNLTRNLYALLDRLQQQRTTEAAADGAAGGCTASDGLLAVHCRVVNVGAGVSVCSQIRGKGQGRVVIQDPARVPRDSHARVQHRDVRSCVTEAVQGCEGGFEQFALASSVVVQGTGHSFVMRYH